MSEQRQPLSLDHRIAIGATHIGITRSEYRRHIEADEKWCSGHHDWHPRTADVFYTRPATRDGLDNVCKEIARARSREIMRRTYSRRCAERAAKARDILARVVARDGRGRGEAV